MNISVICYPGAVVYCRICKHSPPYRPPPYPPYYDYGCAKEAHQHIHIQLQTRTSTMTTFEPSLSASLRASSHDAPSMADQLPSINFGFDELRSRMNQFTARFDDFIEKGRRRVLEERNQFRMNVAEIHGKTFYSSFTAQHTF